MKTKVLKSLVTPVLGLSAIGTIAITSTSCTASKTPSKKIPVESVKLKQSSLKLNVDQTSMLIATIYPEEATNKELEWKSSNEKVATVDKNGNVVAISVGTTTITVTTKDGNFTDTCTIIVSEKVIPVERIELLNKHDIRLFTGERVGVYPEDFNVKTHQFEVSIEPEDATNKNVTWESSDTSIATVDKNGKVTAIKPGKVTIIVRSEDNQWLSDDCTVTILGAEVNEDQEFEMSVNETRQLSIKVLPESAPESSYVIFSWHSSDPKRVATVDSEGNVTAIGEGSVEITARAWFQNDDGYGELVVKWQIRTRNERVISISLKESELALSVGKSGKFDVIFNPTNATNKELTWTSNNDEVATVDQEGNVTARSVGNAMITVTSKDNESAYDIGFVRVTG